MHNAEQKLISHTGTPEQSHRVLTKRSVDDKSNRVQLKVIPRISNKNYKQVKDTISKNVHQFNKSALKSARSSSRPESKNYYPNTSHFGKINVESSLEQPQFLATDSKPNNYQIITDHPQQASQRQQMLGGSSRVRKKISHQQSLNDYSGQFDTANSQQNIFEKSQRSVSSIDKSYSRSPRVQYDIQEVREDLLSPEEEKPTSKNPKKFDMQKHIQKIKEEKIRLLDKQRKSGSPRLLEQKHNDQI